MKKALFFLGMFGFLLLVALYGRQIREYGFYAVYSLVAPEDEFLMGPPPDYPDELRSNGVRVVGMSMRGESKTREVMAFGCRSWYDHRDGYMYYAFHNPGAVDVFLHSDFFPKQLGWRHLTLKAGQDIYVRLPSDGNIELLSYVLSVSEHPDPEPWVPLMASSMTVIVSRR